MRAQHEPATARRFLPAALILLSAALALAGCTTTGPSKEELNAQALVQQGQYTQAAEEFLRLAQTADAPVRQRLRLAAVSALLDAGDLVRARTLLDATDVSSLAGDIKLRKRTLLARMARLDDQPNRVLELLPTGTPTRAGSDLVRQVGELRAWAYDNTGRFLQAANERVQIDPLFLDPAEQAANRQALWDSLMQADVLSLEQARVPPPDVFGGWVELATIAIRFQGDPAALGEAIANWTTRYPTHPASAGVVQDVVEASKTMGTPPRHVALLLPLSGPFAKVAAAVRDGFLAAWFSDQANSQRPLVSIYSTSDAEIWEVYETAIGAGADFVVGPLSKPAVSALASVNMLPVPTLALNFADPPVAPTGPERPRSDPAAADEQTSTGAADESGVDPDGPDAVDDARRTMPRVTRGLYQFALSPEGEARGVAERAWSDGYAQAAVIWPEGNWGSRVSSGFSTAWEDLGGLVVQTQAYTSDAKEMSIAVQKLLGVDQSKERWRVVRKTLNRKVEHQPRRRQDIEFIFMAGFPTQARQIRPQLEFHHAAGLPVYSTSHVFTGVPDPAADIDLNGVVFGDAPWILVQDAEGSGLRANIDRLWGDSASGVSRLFAFGADAYGILPHLGRLRSQASIRFPGHTGQLTVGRDNRVQRGLLWARFNNGTPRLLDTPPPAE